MVPHRLHDVEDVIPAVFKVDEADRHGGQVCSLGAAETALGGDPFSILKERITSPGGTTISGLQILERSGIRGILMDAVETAAMRSKELSEIS